MVVNQLPGLVCQHSSRSSGPSSRVWLATALMNEWGYLKANKIVKLNLIQSKIRIFYSRKGEDYLFTVVMLIWWKPFDSFKLFFRWQIREDIVVFQQQFCRTIDVCGVSDSVLAWFESCCFSRTQVVVVETAVQPHKAFISVYFIYKTFVSVGSVCFQFPVWRHSTSVSARVSLSYILEFKSWMVVNKLRHSDNRREALVIHRRSIPRAITLGSTNVPARNLVFTVMSLISLNKFVSNIYRTACFYLQYQRSPSVSLRSHCRHPQLSLFYHDLIQNIYIYVFYLFLLSVYYC